MFAAANETLNLSTQRSGKGLYRYYFEQMDNNELIWSDLAKATLALYCKFNHPNTVNNCKTEVRVNKHVFLRVLQDPKQRPTVEDFDDKNNTYQNQITQDYINSYFDLTYQAFDQYTPSIDDSSI